VLATISFAGFTSITWSLNWSLIKVLPRSSRTARVGRGTLLLPGRVFVR
jgi:hypothetical protein